MPISAWFPRPVRVDLGDGQIVVVEPLRLADFGVIEAWIEAEIPSPLERLDETSTTYEADLRAAYDLYENDQWPPEPFSAEWRDCLYGSSGGRAIMLSVILRANAELIATLAEMLSRDVMIALELLALQIRPDTGTHSILSRIDRFLGLPEFEPDEELFDGEPTTWTEAVGELCVKWGPERTGKLTVRQFKLIRGGGKEEPITDAQPKDAALRETVNQARSRFFFPQGIGRPAPEPAPIVESSSTTLVAISEQPPSCPRP